MTTRLGRRFGTEARGDHRTRFSNLKGVKGTRTSTGRLSRLIYIYCASECATENSKAGDFRLQKRVFTGDVTLLG
jgi:hypothetical protein